MSSVLSCGRDEASTGAGRRRTRNTLAPGTTGAATGGGKFAGAGGAEAAGVGALYAIGSARGRARAAIGSGCSSGGVTTSGAAARGTGAGVGTRAAGVGVAGTAATGVGVAGTWCCAGSTVAPTGIGIAASPVGAGVAIKALPSRPLAVAGVAGSMLTGITAGVGRAIAGVDGGSPFPGASSKGSGSSSGPAGAVAPGAAGCSAVFTTRSLEARRRSIASPPPAPVSRGASPRMPRSAPFHLRTRHAELPEVGLPRLAEIVRRRRARLRRDIGDVPQRTAPARRRPLRRRVREIDAMEGGHSETL